MFRGTSCAEAASLETLIVSIKAEPPFQSDSIKILPTHLKDAATKKERLQSQTLEQIVIKLDLDSSLLAWLTNLVVGFE